MKRSLYVLVGVLIHLCVFAQEKTSLSVSFSEDLPVLNPIYAVNTEEAQFFTAIHEGLVQYDPEYLFPVPAIAESWEVSKNGTRYTFTLREDAAFSNGDPISAQDVVDSWTAQIDAGSDAYFAAFFDAIAGVPEYRKNKGKKIGLRAVHPQTLQVDLQRTTPHFLKMLCHHSFTITHTTLRLQGKTPANAKAIPYSGPYFIQEIDDETAILSKNTHYWNHDTVFFDTIYASFDEYDPDKITDLYNSELIDWILSSNVNFEELSNREAIAVDETFSSTFLFFRTTGAWGNPDIRRALALLVNWGPIRSRENFFAPSANLVPAIPGYTQAKSINTQDREQALKLLAEHGYSSENRLPVLRIALPSPYWVEMLEIPLKQAWSDFVEDVVIFNVPQNLANTDYYATNTNYDIGVLSWIADYTDPYALLELFVEGSTINFGDFQDDAFTEAINKSLAEPDREKRYAFLSEAEEILLQSAAIFPVSRNTAVNVIDKNRYDGWFSNPLDIHPFATIRLNPEATPEGITNHLSPESLLVHRDIDAR